MAEFKKTKNFCARCQRTTNHNILFTKLVNSGHEDYHCAWRYMTIECMGCESISFREDYEDYESSYPDQFDNWVIDISTSNYPSSLKKSPYPIRLVCSSRSN